MALTSAATFRSYGPAASFVDVPDGTINWYLDAAERRIASLIGKRGYSELTDADTDYTLAVFEIATWKLMVGVRGVNPQDPAHLALKAGHDEAMAWVGKVAKGDANISGAEPARGATGAAGVISTLETTGTSERGW
ncbi:MAG: hypothetical protein ACRCU1_03415 [Alsobacter sp.]